MADIIAAIQFNFAELDRCNESRLVIQEPTEQLRCNVIDGTPLLGGDPDDLPFLLGCQFDLHGEKIIAPWREVEFNARTTAPDRRKP